MTGLPIVRQVETLRRAAAGASAALSKWIGRPTRLTIRSTRALPLADAVAAVGAADAPLVACGMRISGSVEGMLVLTCADAAGLSLADLVLGREPDPRREWGEIETSAVAETANIIGCAYLNALSETAGPSGQSLLPSPPWFVRDYAAAVMQAVIVPQAVLADDVFLGHTEFAVADSPIRCGLLFVPAAEATR